jgi:hypothetical protein
MSMPRYANLTRVLGPSGVVFALLLGASCAAPVPAPPPAAQPDLTGLWLGEGMCDGRRQTGTSRIWKSGKHFVSITEAFDCPPMNWKGAKGWEGTYGLGKNIVATAYWYRNDQAGHVIDTKTENVTIYVLDSSDYRMNNSSAARRLEWLAAPGDENT